MTALWIIQQALWRYGGLVPVVTAGVGLVTPTTEARGLLLFALLYVPCALVLATLDARRARVASAEVRLLMGQQASHRLAVGFPDGITVQAKSGSLMGRNRIAPHLSGSRRESLSAIDKKSAAGRSIGALCGSRDRLTALPGPCLPGSSG